MVEVGAERRRRFRAIFGRFNFVTESDPPSSNQLGFLLLAMFWTFQFCFRDVNTNRICGKNDVGRGKKVRSLRLCFDAALCAVLKRWFERVDALAPDPTCKVVTIIVTLVVAPSPVGVFAVPPNELIIIWQYLGRFLSATPHKKS